MTAAEIPVVPPRQPCPCGSGRRYKACHGSGRADRAITQRPFAGRADETEWVALREIVPAATAPLTLRDDPGRPVTLATVLPMAWPGMVRGDGAVFVGLQTQGRSGDVSRDAGHAITEALAAEPGSFVQSLGRDDAAPRLQDLLTDDPIEVTLHEGFDFWVEGIEDPTGAVATSMERANASIVPTARLAAAPSAYWCRMKERCHLRWVMPHDEDALLDVLARLAAARELGIGEGTRYVGSFRAHGLLVPVWDLPHETDADAIEAPVAALRTRVEELLAEPRPLTDDERRARSGLLSRQLTLR